MRKSKLLICALFVSLFVSALPGTGSLTAEAAGENAAASGLQDENQQRLEEITAMDENGSIYEIGESDGSLDEAVEVDESGEIITDDQEEISEEESEEVSEEASEEGSEEVSDENAENGIAMFSLEPEDRSASVLVVNFNTGSGVTTEYSGGGYTSGSYGADAAYLGTDKNGDIKFMLAGVKATVDKDLVELVRYSDVADKVSYYKVSNGKLYHYISQNLNKSPSSTINNGPAPSYLKSGTKYYSYDGHYFYSDYSVMSKDYQNGAYGASAVNSGNAFYNYFQFADMNGSTSYSADELESILSKAMGNAGVSPSASKLTGTAASFIKYQNKYGVNALLSLGIAINESGWGTSSIANNKNNLFGLNAVDSSPGQSANYFKSVDDCIREFMDKWMANGYLDSSDWRNNGELLGNKAEGINVMYASDPYWGEKAAAHAWNLDSLGGSRDYLGLGPSEDEPEPEPEPDEPEVPDTPTTDKPSDEGQNKPSDDDQNKPSDEDQNKPSDDDQNKPSDDDQNKPSDDDQNKPSDDDQNKPSDDDQNKPSDDDQNKPSDDDQNKPSDDDQNKPSDDEQNKPVTDKPVTPPASNVVVPPTNAPSDDVSDDETTGSESKPEAKPETKPEADDTSDDSEKEPVQKPESDPAAEDGSDNKETKPETDTVKEQILAVHESGISVKGKVSGKLGAVQIEPNTDKYTEYVSADPVKGKVVLGVYDITLDGTSEGKVQLTFTVGTEYNGRDVVILHYTDDGNYEKYAGTVKNGQVTINVDSFSPFVIALADAGSAGDGTVPQTGVNADPGSLAVIMILAAALGMTALLKRRSQMR